MASKNKNLAELLDANGDVLLSNLDNVVVGYDKTFLDVSTEDGTGSMSVPAGTQAQRPTLASSDYGHTRFNTDTGSLEFWDGTTWINTNLIPEVDSVTGTITDSVATDLTIAVTNATDTVSVVFSESGSEIARVDDIDASSGSLTVAVPSVVYGQTAGDTITISVVNQDGTPSSNSISKTVFGLGTGGTRTVDSSTGDIIHTFLTTDNFVVPSANNLTNVSFLVIAGGGGASGDLSGGGGAGGYRSSWNNESSGGGYSAENKISFTAGSTTLVTVGSGGAGAPDQATRGSAASFGNNGTGSSIGSTITTVGGGRAGQYDSSTATTSKNGANGGSGGGAGSPGSNQGTPGSGTAGQGYAGGTATIANAFSPYSAGGGGGAGSAGGNAAPEQGGAGGDGVESSITGTTVGRAGGGGGSNYGQGASNYTTGSGLGTDGGGNGGTGEANNGGLTATNGTQYTGGGGGGGAWSGTSNPTFGGNGGDGIVVIRYSI